MLKIMLRRRLKQIRSEKERTRNRAAKKLSKARDTRSVQPLIKMLKIDENYIRQTVAVVLGEICDMQAVPALLKAIKDGDEEVSQAATLAMGMIRDAHTFYRFSPMLKGKNIEEKASAQDKLIELGNEWTEQIMGTIG